MRSSKFYAVLAPISAGILAAALFFQSCTGDGPDPNANTLRIRVEQDVTGLQPVLAKSSYARSVAGQIFQMLGNLDPQTLELKPLIIKAMPQARPLTDGPHKGGIAYDFELLDEAAWDNGSPLTGHDVVFTLKMIMNPLMPTAEWRGYYEYIRDVEVDKANPKKFTVYMSEYYILGLETLCQTPIFPAYHYDPGGNLADIPLADLCDPKKSAALAQSNPKLKAFADEAQQPKYATEKAFISGSGPYQMEFLKAGEGVVLVRKKNWWADKLAGQNPLLAAYPEKLVYRPVKEEPAVENMLKNSELDLSMNISAGKFIELKKNDTLATKYTFGTNAPTQYSYIMCNLRDPKLADKQVRRALAHAVDYDYLLTTVGKGMAKRTIGPINPAKPYYNSALTPYDFNLDKSRQLLTDAGWKDTDGNGIVDKNIGGKKTELSFKILATTTSEATRLTVEKLKETAQKVGIGIEIVATDLQKLTSETRAGNFELAALAAATFPGADDTYQNLHSKSLAPAGDNRSGFVNATADKLMESIRTEQDLTKRYELYKQLQQIIHEELPNIYLTSPEQRYVVAQRFVPMMTVNRPGYYEHLFKLK